MDLSGVKCYSDNNYKGIINIIPAFFNHDCVQTDVNKAVGIRLRFYSKNEGERVVLWKKQKSLR
jgi:hypothetical protein